MKPLSDEDLIARLHAEEVPEPSPLFWEHLSQRVHDAVAAEPIPSRRWFTGLNAVWAGGAVAAIAVVLIGVSLSVRRQPVDTGSAGSAAMTQTVATDAAAVGVSLPALDDDVSFAVMEELASEIDFEEAGAAGLMVSPGAAEDAVTGMSGEDQRALVELLQEEIKNSKSL